MDTDAGFLAITVDRILAMGLNPRFVIRRLLALGLTVDDIPVVDIRTLEFDPKDER